MKTKADFLIDKIILEIKVRHLNQRISDLKRVDPPSNASLKWIEDTESELKIIYRNLQDLQEDDDLQENNNLQEENENVN
jgi:hypothetical protein